MAKPPALAFEPGTVLLSRLRILRVVGRGGMGIVYEVDDLVRDCKVALKVLTADPADDERRLRFEREARAASILGSPHVVRVFEAGVLEAGTPYFVMELLEGSTLEQMLTREPLSCATAVAYVLEALDAVIEAHAAGLVHRDLKPANLFVANTANGTSAIKVLDFGVVKEVQPDGPQLTVTGSSVGTPAYMAPEQVRAGGTVDARADIWALGVTLYELVTGTLPFDASSVPGVLARILRDEPRPIRALRKDVPASLDLIVERCLAKDPAMRFASATELAEALHSVLPSLPTSLPQRTARMTSPSGRSRIDLAETLAAPAVRPDGHGIGDTTTLDGKGRTTVGTRQRKTLALRVTSIVVVVAAGLLLWMALVTRARRNSGGAAAATDTPTPTPTPAGDRQAPAATAASSVASPVRPTPRRGPAERTRAPKP
jgi:serine/threonine-protein kinase